MDKPDREAYKIAVVLNFARLRLSPRMKCILLVSKSFVLHAVWVFDGLNWPAGSL